MSRLPGPRTPVTQLTAGMRALRNPYDSLLDTYRRYGPVSATGYGPVRYVYLLGRDANEFILSSRDARFEWREALKALIPVEGDTALVVTDGAEHDRRRRLVQPAFAQRRLADYFPIIQAEAAASMDGLSGAVDLYATFKQTIRRIAIRSLFGDTLSTHAETFGRHLQVAIDYANLPPFLIWNRDLPFTPFRRAMRATKALDGIIYAEIARRRTTGDQSADLLAGLIAAADEHGALSDVEIRDQVVSLIAGGYETTAALAAWAAYTVLAHPEVEGKLRAELDARPTETLEDLQTCRYLDAVINETLRLHGPTPFSARHAPDPFEFAGHTIPARSTVVYSGYVTHRLEEYWDEPLTFEPQRWIDGPAPDPYVFVPFGGGYRRCIGFALASLETKALLVELLRRHHPVLEHQTVRRGGYSTMYPKNGVNVRIA